VPFILEHCVKTVALFVALIPATAATAALWRLAGGRARDFMDAPLLAATPAEFWRRYNRPVQQFFYEDFFKRVGGLRSPVRATLVIFAVSALIHEYVFAVTLGRVQGYQTLFFLLQGLGVAATVRLRPAGWRVWLWIGATWIFNLTTSMFFFASVNGAFPFYSRGLPEWLAGW
jgi:D-alanyl-lipoteichoic acid acyltransferase DltB (MBOAT superfamily)